MKYQEFKNLLPLEFKRFCGVHQETFQQMAKMVDTLIKIAMDLIEPRHLRNWFAHCCYCTS